MANPFRYHVPWVIWLGIISFLSLLPGDQLPDLKFDWISIDTLAHFLMYLGFSFLLLVGFVPPEKKIKKKLNLSDLRVYGVVILVAIIIGYLIELIQGNLIYRRYFDTADIVVNSFGTIFGGFAYGWIGRKLI